MRFPLVIAAAFALLATGAGYTGYRMSCDAAMHAAVARGDRMEWLRTDFHLSDAQLGQVRRIHESYAGVCAEHCRLIQEATRARGALEAAHGDRRALDEANRRLEEMRAACERAIDGHVRKVAGLMSPEDGRRYLALVLPRIAGFDHAAAPDLRLGRPN